MKKTFLKCLALLAVGICLFVSCSVEQSIPSENTEGFAYVVFSDKAMRSFNASYAAESYNELYWFYRATKTDNYGTTGATDASADPVRVNSSGAGLGTNTLKFSAGKWTFELFAYKSGSVSSTQVYKTEKEISVELTAGTTTTIAANVVPVQNTGKVELKEAYFKYASDGTSAPNFKMVATSTDSASQSYTFDNISGGSNNLILKSSTTEKGFSIGLTTGPASMSVGTYKCEVTACLPENESNPIATSTFYFAVYGGATTTISGDLTESTFSEVKFSVPERVIETKAVDEQNKKLSFGTDLSSTDDATEVQKLSAKATVVELDLSKVSPKEGSESITSVTLETKVVTGAAAAEGFKITDTSSQEESGTEVDTEAVLCSISLTAKDQTGAELGKVSEDKKDSTTAKDKYAFGTAENSSEPIKQSITRYIGKGLNGKADYDKSNNSGTLLLKIYYNGKEESGNIEITKYVSSTGYLTFTTTHFSTFVIVDTSKYPAYISSDTADSDTTKRTYYASLEEAISKVPESTTIYLNKEIKSVSKTIEIDKKIKLNFNQNKISAGSSAIKVVKNGELTIFDTATDQTDIISGLKAYTGTDNNVFYPATKETITSKLSSAGTIKLYDDISLSGENDVSKPYFELSKNITLDLNNHTISSNLRVFKIHAGTLIIQNGTIKATIADSGKSAILVDCTSDNAGVKLESSAIIEAPTSYGITAFGGAHTATLDIDGTIESGNPCIGSLGNNTTTTVIVNVTKNAKLTQDSSGISTAPIDKVAIYQPSTKATLNITGGTITSKDGSAVEIRSGEATISGGTLTSNAVKYSVVANANGPTVVGAALAVSQHVIDKNIKARPIKVTVKGGTFSGIKQLAVENPENNSTECASAVKVTDSDNIMDSSKIVGVKTGNDYYPTFEAALGSSANGEFKLSGNVTVGTDFTASADKDYSIDLNGYTLTLNESLTIGNSKKVTFKNGNINSNAGSYGLILTANGSLELDNVVYTASNRAIRINEHANQSTLIVNNSTVETTEGAFAIQTDATKEESENVTIKITGSTIRAGKNKRDSNEDDSTAFMFNVKGTVTIENSKFYGRRQGAMLRGGTHTINNSTFESTGTSTNYYDSGDYLETSWGTGNEVPLAAIVIGNRSGSYPYPTKVTFEGTNTLSVAENSVRKQLYVYQNDNEHTVTVDGDVNVNWTVNSNRNGATYPTAKIGNTIYSSLEAAVSAAKTEETVTLINDVDLTYYSCSNGGNDTGKGLEFAEGVTFDLASHTITVNNYGVVWRGKDLTIQNGTFNVSEDSTKPSGYGSYALFIRGNDEDDKLTAGETMSNSEWTATIKNITTKGGVNVGCHKLVVMDCTVYGTNYYSLWADELAQIRVESGTFTSESKISKITLSTVLKETSSIEILEGTFSTLNKEDSLFYGNLTLKGGTYNKDPEDVKTTIGGTTKNIVDSEFSVVDNSDGTWTVVSKK